MATQTTTQKIEKNVDDMLTELESLGEEIELKVKLASMEVRDQWRTNLEPKLFEARLHAKEAKNEAKKAVSDTLRAFKDFAAAL